MTFNKKTTEEQLEKIMSYRNWLQEEEYIDSGYIDPELHYLYMFWRDIIREKMEKKMKKIIEE